MPGLTLCLMGDACSVDKEVFLQAVRHGVTNADHEAKELAWQRVLLGYVAYPTYPFRIVRKGEFQLIVEGGVYNKDRGQVDEELGALAEGLFRDTARRNMREWLTSWLLETDGEYLVVMLDTDQARLVVLSDSLGRLPAYWYADDTRLVVSRHPASIQALKPQPAFDRLGWAEHLWLGYPIGGRTLFKDVRRLPQAVFLQGSVEGGLVRTECCSLYEFNFEDQDHGISSAKEAASGLVEPWIQACRLRGEQPGVTQNVVSLSGGMDSREVACGMSRAGVEFVAATMCRGTGEGRRDIPGARSIANCLNVEWELFEIPGLRYEDQEQLIRMKLGHNYVYMAAVLNYYRQVVARWGAGSMLVTGDGGDKVFPDQRIPEETPSMDALTAGIRRWHSRFPLDEAAAMLRLSTERVLADLRETLESYPEGSLPLKGVHFVIANRAGKWLFEAEDRIRSFLWQTTPFYDLTFFRASMRIPESLKVCRQLQRRFLMALSPECARIPDANIRCAPASPFYPLAYRLKTQVLSLPRPMKSLFGFMFRHGKKRWPVYKPDVLMQETVDHVLSRSSPLAEYVDIERAKHFLENCREAPMYSLLATLLMVERYCAEWGLCERGRFGE